MRAGKTAVIAATVCACAVAAVTEAVGAAAAGRRPAKTSLTIATWPRGVFGYVKSSDAARCAQNRKVDVFVKRPDGRVRRVAVPSARRDQVGYEWLASASGGDVYAVTAPKLGCGAARSRTVSIPPRADVPACPSLESKCLVYVELVSLPSEEGGLCPFFFLPRGGCPGRTTGTIYLPTSPGWESNFATFEWDGSQDREVRYRAYDKYNGNVTAEISGRVPCPICAAFNVSNAFQNLAPPTGGSYYTPDRPGVEPGRDGGPLFLAYKWGPCSYSGDCEPTLVGIFGILYRR